MSRNLQLLCAVVGAALVSGAASLLVPLYLRIPAVALSAGVFFFIAQYLLSRPKPAPAAVPEETFTLPEPKVESVRWSPKPSGDDPLVSAFRAQLVECHGTLQQASQNIARLFAFVDHCRLASATLQSLSSDSHFLEENAKHTYAIADNLAKNADPAFALAGQVQATVATLGDELAVSLAETETLMVESGKISQILVLMNEISSKTHVLSINASIVAARAGVHGKAFDVVAREIRHLAQGTEESLKSIESLIRQLQERIMNVVARTRDTSASILQQKDALLSVAGVLQGVILSVEVIRTTADVSSEKADAQQKSMASVIENLEGTFANDETFHLDLTEIKALMQRIETSIRP